MALLCSTNFTTLKILGDGRNESVVAAVRFVGALIPFLALLPKYWTWGNIKGGLEIGMWCAFAYIAQAIGLQTADASHGAFICSLAMVVVPVLKSLNGEKVSNQLWGAVALAVSGTALLIGIAGGESAAISQGDLICGGCALGFGLMFYRMDTYASEKEFDPIGCTAWQVVALAIAMVGWMLASLGPAQSAVEVTALLSSSPEVLGTLFFVSIVTTAGVLYVETAAMEEIDGTEAGIIFASEPVWATIFASLVLGESFGAKEGAGAVLILGACLLTQVKLGGEEEAKTSSLPEGAATSSS
jgi:drug/metabolite transporter (DMT)-like permease